MKFILPILSLISSSFAETVTIPAEVYSPKSLVHRKTGKITLDLPEGWKHRENQGAHYLIGGSDVYLSVTLAYDRLNVMNFGKQFGTTTPPKSKIGDVTVFHQIKNDGGGFLRKLGGDGWSIRASLSSYPAFKGKDLSEYEKAVVKMIATAKVKKPEVPKED